MNFAEEQLNRTSVVVIGAGPAGLAVAACLSRASIPHFILERADTPAASWHRHYDRLHLHTHKRFSGLPYHPWPREAPAYPSRLEVIDYLTDYAARFKLQPRLGEEVTRVRQKARGWEVLSSQGHYLADCVVLATGFDAVPLVPSWLGQDTFAGTVLHSSSYRNGEPYRDRAVLVVGFGNSGGEIALDLYEHGARVSMAVRGAVNIVPRELFGLPIEQAGRWLERLPVELADLLARTVRQRRYGDLGEYGLHFPPYGAGKQIGTKRRIPLIDIGTVDLIRRGAVTVYPGIERFMRGGVVFTDGREKDFSAVVLATGYRTGFPSLLGNLNESEEQARSGAEHPLETRPGLYLCGYLVSQGGRLSAIHDEAIDIARIIAARLRQLD